MVRSEVRSEHRFFLVRKTMVRKVVRSESKFLSATMSALKWPFFRAKTFRAPLRAAKAYIFWLTEQVLTVMLTAK